MSQLLISVKNVQEALLSLEAGADIVDLKDPNVGALGALDLALTHDIMQAIDGRTMISATIGEQFDGVQTLINAIHDRANLGVDIIKIAIGDVIKAPECLKEIKLLTQLGIKLIAVFFAEEMLDFNVLPALNILPVLKEAGFYGAMLDTQKKMDSLPVLLSCNNLHTFVQNCAQLHLKSGLAGSLKPQDIENLLNLHATYIGFRGGVCKSNNRMSELLPSKVIEVKNMLYKHNNFSGQAQKIKHLALHS